MKICDFPIVLRSHTLIVISFGVTFFLLAALFGCGQKSAETQKVRATVTIQNLQTAYGKAVKYRRMYSLFAGKAEAERVKNVAELYRAAARSEDIHAANHAALLPQYEMKPEEPERDSVPVGSLLQTLKMAVSSEEIESDRLYPNLIHTAELEKDSAAIDQFRRTRDADARHAELFREAITREGRIPGVQYFVCSSCGYIMTSEKTEECPVCHTKKDKFE